MQCGVPYVYCIKYENIYVYTMCNEITHLQQPIYRTLNADTQFNLLTFTSKQNQ